MYNLVLFFLESCGKINILNLIMFLEELCTTMKKKNTKEMKKTDLKKQKKIIKKKASQLATTLNWLDVEAIENNLDEIVEHLNEQDNIEKYLRKNNELVKKYYLKK